ncbi:unnamed protein product [Brassicogethes aeneus]|uniref:Polyglutamine-binding protein 1 n=1 Tax=Brassicogethes aeneus TaxID=1431903 RepID=A0A9P0FHR3_BRAAE|nr:unnamed protein product [Brassicogethes aeneus]
MPLPPALIAKLSKRGIVAPKKPSDKSKKQDFKGLSACPNKNNIYHDCNFWCETHWKGVLTPDAKYVRNMQKLMVKYSLPNNWTEIFDKGVGRYYYWNMENDMVSWLPPKHPKSIKSISAAKLREKRLKQTLEQEEKKDKEPERDRREKDRDSDQDSDDERPYRSKHSERRDRDRDRDDSRYRRDDRHRNKKSRKDDIDPMDPAAYSDIPVGKWSDGLENNSGRADNTASGVLYQQRPYPAPGEILAANKDKIKKK